MTEIEEEVEALHKALKDLVKHSPTIIKLASAANVLSGERHDGVLQAYNHIVTHARATLGKYPRR